MVNDRWLKNNHKGAGWDGFWNTVEIRVKYGPNTDGCRHGLGRSGRLTDDPPQLLSLSKHAHKSWQSVTDDSWDEDDLEEDDGIAGIAGNNDAKMPMLYILQ